VIRKIKTKIVMPIGIAERAILFSSEKSGLNVPRIMVHKPPSHTYATTNVAKLIEPKIAVAAAILLKVACDSASDMPIICEG
jgi:hypothetical protein